MFCFLRILINFLEVFVVISGLFKLVDRNMLWWLIENLGCLFLVGIVWNKIVLWKLFFVCSSVLVVMFVLFEYFIVMICLKFNWYFLVSLCVVVINFVVLFFKFFKFKLLLWNFLKNWFVLFFLILLCNDKIVVLFVINFVILISDFLLLFVLWSSNSGVKFLFFFGI